MILGVGLPDGARVEVVEGKVLIIWDEKDSRRDLWLARLDLWLTEGQEPKDFHRNQTIDNKAIEITGRRKMRMPLRRM